jgi:polyisoprenyl-teichoic acid--peptidoglycan teichoic acid transferase
VKVYGSGQRRGGVFKRALLVLFALLVLLLLYVFLPFGSQRVVLLGSDARADEASRSDTIVVAKAGGGMLAVPRDTLVEVPGVGQDKVNAAFAYGGPELTVRTLEDFTGLGIGDYAVLDFGGTEEIVDALGGITVEVEEPIETEQDGEFFSIPAGTQELNGSEALAYVRYRDAVTADIGRVARQQRFLLALAGEPAPPSGDREGRVAQRRDEHEPGRGRALRRPVRGLWRRDRAGLPRYASIHRRHLLLGPRPGGRAAGGRGDGRVGERGSLVVFRMEPMTRLQPPPKEKLDLLPGLRVAAAVPFDGELSGAAAVRH